MQCSRYICCFNLLRMEIIQFQSMEQGWGDCLILASPSSHIVHVLSLYRSGGMDHVVTMESPQKHNQPAAGQAESPKAKKQRLETFSYNGE